ncbi:MAG: NAD(P)/FAD-dependent oxidoreductase [Solirubrobacteraceae bacterium]
MSDDCDVAIVGAGDVGAAIARELARFELAVTLIDSGDVGAGTSKANTAILHSGFDAKPGTYEARLVARGHDLLLAYAAEVGIPVAPTGALLIAWTEEELERLPTIARHARANGYTRARHIPIGEIYRLEPNLAPGALGAVAIPDELIICPWTVPLAFATQAVLGGVQLRRFERVDELAQSGAGWRLRTERGELHAAWVVNAAGLQSDVLHRMAGLDGFTVRPRRGELIVFDKLARGLVSHILLPVPTGRTKGVLVAPTVFGNVMVGPTADDVQDTQATQSTAGGIAALMAHCRRLMPALAEHEVTAVYAGLRAATEHADYQLVVDAERHYACAGGIRSTGLSASMAIAEWMRDELAAAGLALRERDGGLPAVRMPNIGEAATRPYEDASLIATDAAYGRIVCFCERVSAGELRDAVAASIPPRDLDGLKRRTRVLTGRCQGFYCGASVAAQLAALTGQDPGTIWRRRG